MIATALEMAQLRERSAWAKYTASQNVDDLVAWRRTLGVLNAELEHRTRILAEHVRTSGLQAEAVNE